MNSSASLMYSALALTSSSVAMHTMCKISCVLNVSYSQSLSDRIAFTAPLRMERGERGLISAIPSLDQGLGCSKSTSGEKNRGAEAEGLDRIDKETYSHYSRRGPSG